MAAPLALAAPVWYTNGTGGNNPNIPDFYQHQNWTDGSNGWESNGGWCFWTAYADVFYDLTQQGYPNLYTAGGTSPTAANWYTAMYGATSGSADVATSDIYRLAKNLGNVQTYLNSTANTSAVVTGGSLGALISNTYSVSSGSLDYMLPTAGSATTTMPVTGGVASFTNYLLKDLNAEVLYKLGPGTTTPQYLTGTLSSGTRNQGRWWGGFHYVAVAGISVAGTLDNSTVLIADPDSNLGSGAASAGWPIGPPAVALGFPFKSPSTAALPVVANASPLTQGFAGFTFSVSGGAANVSSTASPQDNGTVVQQVEAIYAGAVVKSKTTASLQPSDTKTDITLTLAPGSSAVDGVLVLPSTMTDSSGTAFASDFSFTDDSNPSVAWSYTRDTTDPFGNALPNGAAEFDLSGGTAFRPGETADLTLGTPGDFTGSGYDVLLHFQGDPANVWLPEMVNGTSINSSDVAAVQTSLAVPEPSGTALLGVGLGAAAFLRWLLRRTRPAP
jgi:hypothetical protein